MPDKDDIKLAIKASKGDIEAFEELVGLYYKGIVGVCYSLLMNASDAQDCAQETFLKAYKNISNYNAQSSFFTWIYKIATNTSYDLLRKKSRKPITSLDEKYDTGDNELSMQIKDKSIDIQEKYERDNSDRRVNEIINSLPEQFSRILRLKDIEGLSYKEIADIENIKDGTVKSRLSRARQAFYDLAKDEDLY